MKSDVEKSIKSVRQKLKKTTDDNKKHLLREELKRLKSALCKEKAS